jgi:hypothetical protein
MQESSWLLPGVPAADIGKDDRGTPVRCWCSGRERRIPRSSANIAGRDRTKLIDGLHRQVEMVRSALKEFAPEVPVHGCLCFLAPMGLFAESGLPLLRRLSIDGYPLFYPRALAKRLNTAGPINPDQARGLQAELARRLPPA